MPVKFKVGDRVKIAESSRWYVIGDTSNPIECEGTVISTDGEHSIDLPISVRWDNGIRNSYDNVDLKHANPSSSAVKTYAVSHSFVKEAYKAAGAEWRKKLSKNFNMFEESLFVEESFILLAHRSACSQWQEKIEKEFPEVFKNTSKYHSLVKSSVTDTLGTSLYVNVEGDRHSILNDVELLVGVAGSYPEIPASAKHCGFYVPGYANIVPKVVHVPAGNFYAVLLEKKQ